MRRSLVIVGQGMAAAKLCEELTAHAPDRFEITVVGAEPHAPYNRVLLSEVLAGRVAAEETRLKPAAWWDEAGIRLVGRTKVEAIDRAAREVTLSDGRRLAYDHLVLATGSHPVRLPLAGIGLPGVHTFRDLADVDALMAAARTPGLRAVVIGGGLLGLEAAAGLAGAGVDTTLVHLMDRLMERQLDHGAAALLKAAVEAQGVKVLLDAVSAAVTGEERATGLALKDGRVIPADLVVVACGVNPNADLARAAGIEVRRGVVVDDTLTTSDAAIHALGECCEHAGLVYGLVAPAYEQARVLARHLGGEEARYGGSVVSTNLKVSGVHVFSAGQIFGNEDAGADGGSDILLTDRRLGLYRRLMVKDGRLVGAVLFGDTADGLYFLDLITKATPIAALRHQLAFGRPAAEAA